MKKIFGVILSIVIVSSGLFSFLFAGTENVSAQTYVSGNITTNTKWTSTGSPYIIQSDIIVQSGVTLTVDPGVTVKFDGLYSIVVDGTLKAIGTKINPIIFTSNFTSPKKGDWYTLRLRTSNNVINWTEIEYANYGVFVTYYGGNNKILNTTINDCSVDGIYITNSNNNTVQNCNITSNNGYGMTLYESDNTSVENCNINNNVYFGIYFNASTYTQVKNCNISNINGKGIILYSNSHNTSIINCGFYNNSNIGIDLSGTSNNFIKNTNIIGNTGMGIDFGGVTSNQSLDYCNIKNNGDTGIDLKGSSFINITNCNISKNKGNGGIYSGFPVNNITISNSEIFNNLAGNGVDFYGAMGVNLINTKSIKNVGCGITIKMLDGIDNNVIKGCEISANTGKGIYFYTTHDISNYDRNNISNNIISHNNEDGINFSIYGYGSTGNDNIIQNNHIHNNDGYGISFIIAAYRGGADKNIIIKNNIYENSLSGIYFKGIEYHSSTNYNNLVDNIIYSNNQHGIHIQHIKEWGGSLITDFNNNKIYSNSIYSNVLQGIFFEAATGGSNMNNNEIFNNTIQLNNECGIYFYAKYSSATISTNSLTNNTITNNKLTGIFFHAANYGVIKENRISNCKIINNNNGILFNNSPINTVIDNFISNNTKSGIIITTNSNSNKIENNYITSNNQSGIIINNSDSNIIIKNDIANNSVGGLNVTNTKGNKIHHNNFKWNMVNGYDSTISLNNWDDGAQGNYWSDYTGTDDNNDGFGEDPYVVPGGGSRDWHPFMKNLNFTPPKIQAVSPVNNTLNVPIKAKFSIQFSKQMNTSTVKGAISISGDIYPVNFSWINVNKTVNFDPSSNLAFNSSYTITIAKSAMDVDGNTLLSEYAWRFTTEDKPKIPTPPTIINKSPTGIDIPVNTKIIVTFSELMDTSSVESAFSLTPSVTGTYSWSQETLTFTPKSNLNYDTQYKVTIDTTARDLENEFIESKFSWQFTTEEAIAPTPPTVIYKSPTGTNVPVDTTITITFSELMDTSSVEAAFLISPSVAGTISWNEATVTFTPDANLEYNTQYSVTINTNAKDQENELMESEFQWQFTTVKADEPTQPTPPNVIDKSPTGIDIPVDSVITITFSENMNKNSVEAAFSISHSVKGKFTWSDATITFAPNKSLNYGTQYIVTISTNAMDLENENLESEFTWKFTTISPDTSTPPTIIDKSPIGNEVSVDTIITITFNELMDTNSVESAFSISPNVEGTFSWNDATLTFTPSKTLDYKTQYVVSISTIAKDQKNDYLESEFSWQFTTISEILPTPPAIITKSPTGNDVSVDSVITITFSELMNIVTVETAFSISPSVEGTFSWDNAILIFTPNKALGYDMLYTVVISTEAKDLEGEALEADYSWKFSTVNLLLDDKKLDHITISPITIQIKIGDIEQFKVKGFDKFDNEISNLTFTWELIGDIGIIDDSGIFTAKKSGIGTIIVTTEDMSAQATIEVVKVEESEIPENKKNVTDLSWVWILILFVVMAILLILIIIIRNNKAKSNKKEIKK